MASLRRLGVVGFGIRRHYERHYGHYISLPRPGAPVESLHSATCIYKYAVALQERSKAFSSPGGLSSPGGPTPFTQLLDDGVGPTPSRRSRSRMRTTPNGSVKAGYARLP